MALGKIHASWEYTKLLSIAYTRTNSWWVQDLNIKNKLQQYKKKGQFQHEEDHPKFYTKNGSHVKKRYVNYNKAVSLTIYVITESKANIKEKQSKNSKKATSPNNIW